MFDFTPVGFVLCLAGVLAISFFSRFFIRAPESQDEGDLLKVIRDFLTEVKVGKGSPLVGTTLLEFLSRYPECALLGLKNGDQLFRAPSQFRKIEAGDLLIVEATSEVLETLVSKERLQLLGGQDSEQILKEADCTIVELVVPADAFAVGRSSKTMDLRWEYSVNVLGIARAGNRITRELSDVIYHVGDILLLQGQKENIARAVKDMGLVFLSERQALFQYKREIFLPVLLFAAAITGNLMGYIDITVAFVGCSLLYVLLGYIKPKEIYSKVEWPVIVLLACLIPLGEGMEAAGSLKVISDSVLVVASGLSPVFILAIIMTVTVLLTNVINNAAAAIIMAPVALEIARQLKVSPDSLLMGVAVAASTAFITPIAHQSNTLVMEPGGYAFKDYSYLGAPLTLIILLLAIPTLLMVWPL
ncbi:MAG: hypothetical protein COT74_10955 [Bdellovibrionales bacterium CG10_big_fil_rev_8_21_14_0_10_45_34]|nr:MAG: hypothetical protein COT74_10955 [Bdellovibrionales bacterium CG10_big_fil_rev_8_21_14_0_10_45_34]